MIFNCIFEMNNIQFVSFFCFFLPFLLSLFIFHISVSINYNSTTRNFVRLKTIIKIIFNLFLLIPQLSGEWKNLRRAFRKLDIHNDGYLTIPEFRSVLRLCNAVLDEDEIYHLLSELDSGLEGKVSYRDFLAKVSA